MDAKQRHTQASIKTADLLKTVAYAVAADGITQLTLPEIEAAIELVSQIVPAGNVPGIILSGLARLPARQPPVDVIKRDVDLLLQGVEQVLDRAVYSAFFAGPAAVIWGYQHLLRLAGKNPEDAFPNGTWQFYVEYALREDTARHANETHGFDTGLHQYHIQLNRTDRLTAWVMALIHGLHDYENLLENEWRERVYIYLLDQITHTLPDAIRYAGLYRDWSKQRPYQRRQDAAPDETYPAYRRRQFDQFLQQVAQSLPDWLRAEWKSTCHRIEEQELKAYQGQMSIKAFLKPDPYGETRIPIQSESLHIGLIIDGHYYLLPIYRPGTAQPVDVTSVRAQIAGLLAARTPGSVPSLTPLAESKRASLGRLWGQLSPATIQQFEQIRLAPIWFNCDTQTANTTLSSIRQAERGLGDHALTVFDTGQTFVFDQSHIFFDGAWGAALAEIVTNEALSWAVYLSMQPPTPRTSKLPASLNISFTADELSAIKKLPRLPMESSAETDIIDLPAMLALRKLFKQRSDLLQLTVNDLLVLYRSIHAVTYMPDPDLIEGLKSLQDTESTRLAAGAALKAIDPAARHSPAILIPMDASLRAPRDRLCPMAFEVPLADLDLLRLHRQTMEALIAYKQARGQRSQFYERFDHLQRTYLGTLAGFGALMSKAKEVALSGESASAGSIKLLAHLPTPLQRLLDQIPGQFDVLNDIIKGREVFSNVGAVAPGSTLTRFISAKDDNEKKTLVWGVLTDDRGIMRLSLRDFRPHVTQLIKAGHQAVAQNITQDYLKTYAYGLNDYVRDLRRITAASRETRLRKPEETDE